MLCWWISVQGRPNSASFSKDQDGKYSQMKHVQLSLLDVALTACTLTQASWHRKKKSLDALTNES